ncbi:MAG TPA: GFA family protein [Rhizomicrobium sp.]
MIRGSCACGGIRFEIDRIRALTHCHCAICRKLSGAAFATYAHVDSGKFRFVAGENLIERYESTPGSFRHSCRVCGSPAPGKATYLPTVSIPAGLLDDDPVVRPMLHVFTSSRAPWWEIQDTLPQHEKWVPGYEPKPAA